MCHVKAGQKHSGLRPPDKAPPRVRVKVMVVVRVRFKGAFVKSALSEDFCPDGFYARPVSRKNVRPL